MIVVILFRFWIAVIFTISCLFIILDTTDVQLVTISVKETINEILIVCDFILGSDARGCAVELIGYFENITVNLTRRRGIREAVVLYELPYPLSCYYRGHAFDIEADGVIASLLVPAVLLYGNESVTLCIVIEVNPGRPMIALISAVTVVLIVVSLVIIIILMILIVMLYKRSRMRGEQRYNNSALILTLLFS